MGKRRFLSLFLAAFLLLGVLTLAGCDTEAPPDEDNDNDNGVPDEPVAELKTITVGLSSAPRTFDPHNHRTVVGMAVSYNWTDGLMQMLHDGPHVLDLAESITLIDPKTYEIVIRQGVTFHNGDFMTADDVVFSLTRLGIVGGMEGETSPRRALIGPMESVEKIDDYTVIVTLERPNQLVQLRNWVHAEIIPKKYFEEVGAEGFTKNPIGVGPFKFVEGDLQSQVVLERYENYYGGAADLPGEVDRIPALDRAILTFIPEATTRIAALMAGDVDIIQDVPFDAIQLLESNPNIRVASTQGVFGHVLFFNTTKAPFDNKLVRQAFAYAIDYDAIVDQLLLGYSEPMYGLPYMNPYKGEPGEGAFTSVQSPYHYNPEKAKALLEEAGVSDLSLVIDVTAHVEQAQIIAQMLGDIGVNASVRVWDAAVIAEEFRKGGRDIYYQRFGNGRLAPQWIRNMAGTGQPTNYSLYSNPEFDDLMSKAMAIVEDTPERNGYLIEAFELILEEMPVITVHRPEVVEACRSHVKNFFVSNAGRVNLHRVDIE